MLENLTKKQKIIFGIIILFMIVIIIFYIYSTLSNLDTSDKISDDLITSTDELEIENTSIDENVTEKNEILVHVSGCIKEEKIVSLPEGSRVNDAIEAAGRTNQ